MKNVVFKVKFNHPNKTKTPKLNINHFSYICTRPRAVYNTGKSFCCFGKVSELGYNSFGEINEFENMKNHIREKSKEKTTFYKGVISLTEEEALAKGFDKRSEWENLIKNRASKIAKEMDIKAENFEYVCSVHMEKGHPHIHFMAWDKNQEIQKTVIPKNRINNIRKDLTNYIFKDELQIFYNIKNKSKDSFQENLKNMFSELDEIFNLNDEEYQKYVKELKSLDLDLNKGKIFNIDLKQKYVNEILRDIYNLKKELPKTGRLNYGFMPEQVKNHLDTISKKILASNIEVRSSFTNYIESVRDISKFSMSNEKYIEQSESNAEKELLKFSGNQILNICKKIGNKEFSIERGEWEKKKEVIEEQQKNYERQEMIGLVSNLINFMTKAENKNRNQLKNFSGEKSLMAKKELAKKLENKSSIDWEQEI